MVKSTIRFSESVVSEVDSLVEEGYFESKSEFYRFASDYVLEQLVESYEPVSIDYDEIKSEIAPQQGSAVEHSPGEVPFFESVVILRKYVLRGNLADAEDFIDHHYEPNHPHAVVLEELLELYRKRDERVQSTAAPPKQYHEGRR
ncbi:hypothetical protein HUB97_15030 [Halorubraceae archaeon YAN]|nr:hypothetical protein [Halorubraceae archaeon YAN]